jgi:predicted extracellular nuclease
VLDYNTEFKSADQVADLYAPTPFRSSDHDPVLVGLDLRSPPGHGHGHGHGRPGRH